ncbi:MAG: hypothetical protein IT317_07415 [Anaerolineales bacterium]|nr:hypothetical protein [Anaerolineales bacterium]
MGQPILVGLDLGTSQVKAAAFAPDGTRLGKATAPYPTDYPQPGWAEQAPADWRQACARAMSELTAQLGDGAADIAALGLSAHAPGLVPVDAAGRALLERVPIWQDERSAPQARALLAEIGAEWVGLGLPLAAFAGKLRWFTETHPELAGQTTLALGVKAYLAQWLTGHTAADPSSEPAAEPAWQIVCAACGWALDRLPPPGAPDAVVGKLRPAQARELGLRPGLPVVTGLNDGAAATLSQGALLAGQAVITLATNGVIYAVTERPAAAEARLSQAIFCWPYLAGRWVVGGQTRAGAACLQWLAGLLGGGEAADAAYAHLLAECAGRPPGGRGVRFFPYLMGQGTPHDNGEARGAFSGLTLATDQADLALAVLEGVAFALREVLDALAGLGAAGGPLGITGGGARSPLWRQIVADVLDRPLGFAEADSCLGAAMLAAAATGVHAEVAAACAAMTGAPDVTQPRPSAAPRYAGLYTDFLRQREAWFGRA